MKNLKGKKVVVVGGSRGTGLAIVKAFLDDEADVLVIGRDQKSLTELVRIFPNVYTLRTDITESAAAVKVFQDSPDVVVLVAGATAPARPIHQLDWETFSNNWNTDVKASFLLAKYALTLPVKSGTEIIFISSGAAIGGSPISGGYAGAKRTQMFIANYAQEASNRLKLGLRFIALAPWRLMKDTGIGEAVIHGYANYLGIPEKDFIAMMMHSQTSEDVAAAVVEFAVQPPEIDKGNVFVVSGNGIVPESNIQNVLLAKK